MVCASHQDIQIHKTFISGRFDRHVEAIRFETQEAQNRIEAATTSVGRALQKLTEDVETKFEELTEVRSDTLARQTRIERTIQKIGNIEQLAQQIRQLQLNITSTAHSKALITHEILTHTGRKPSQVDHRNDPTVNNTPPDKEDWETRQLQIVENAQHHAFTRARSSERVPFDSLERLHSTWQEVESGRISRSNSRGRTPQ